MTPTFEQTPRTLVLRASLDILASQSSGQQRIEMLLKDDVSVQVLGPKRLN